MRALLNEIRSFDFTSLLTLVFIIFFFSFFARIFHTTSFYFEFNDIKLNNDAPKDKSHHETPHFPLLAYVILCHNQQTVKMSTVLLDQYYHPNNSYYVHIDKKASHHKFLLNKYHRPNVKTESIYSGKWASWSLVEMELHALKELLKMSSSWEYVVITSGDSLPLFPPDYLQRLIAFSGENLLTINGLLPEEYNSAISNKKDRFQDACADENCTSFNGAPKNQTIFFGTQWNILTREFVEYICLNPTKDVLEWADFFKSRLVPDESYFPTLAMNNPKFRITEPSKLYKLGISPRFEKWWGDCYYDQKDRYPCYMGPKDFESYLDYPPGLFARKFQLSDHHGLSPFEYLFPQLSQSDEWAQKLDSRMKSLLTSQKSENLESDSAITIREFAQTGPLVSPSSHVDEKFVVA